MVGMKETENNGANMSSINATGMWGEIHGKIDLHLQPGESEKRQTMNKKRPTAMEWFTL
jgi:hypothetical protein